MFPFQKLEPFMTGCRSAAKLAMEVMHQFTSTKVGENLQECKTLLEQHEQKVKEVFLDSRLSALQVEGEQLLIRLEEEKSTLNRTEDYHETVQCVSRLYNQMNEVFCKLEMLTDNRTKRLKQCLQLREFERESEKVTHSSNIIHLCLFIHFVYHPTVCSSHLCTTFTVVLLSLGEGRV